MARFSDDGTRPLPGYPADRRRQLGTVYRATDSVLKRTVAIKLLKPSVSAEFTERFQGEAQRLALMDHPGICKVYDFSATPQASYLVTEWLSGDSLADLEMPIDPIRACRLVAEVADALAHAHSHEIVHRDLKPANIMLDANGHVRVIDFGLSANEDELTSSESSFGGSPAYMAPEQTIGRLHILDGRADIWAVGVILYELVTGKRPFRGQNSGDLLSKIREKPIVSPRTFSSEVPAELEHVILRCLAKKPTDRFATASDLAKELRNIETAHARPPSSHIQTSASRTSKVPTNRTLSFAIRRSVIAAAVAIPILTFPFLLFHFRGDSRQSTTTTNTPPADTTPAQTTTGVTQPTRVHFEVLGLRPSTGQTWAISSDNPQSPDIRTDDKVSLHVTLPSPRHVYIVWLGGDTGTTFLYPGTIGSTRDVGNPKIDRPIDNLLLKVGYITETPSTETVIMIATDNPLAGPAETVQLMTQLPRPEVNTFVPPGTIRGMYFNSETWDDGASTPILMREAYRPLAEFLQTTFSGRAAVQAVSFISGEI